MKIIYDQEADALSIELKAGQSAETVIVDDNEHCMVDFDENGVPIGVEILFVSSKYSITDLTELLVKNYPIRESVTTTGELRGINRDPNE